MRGGYKYSNVPLTTTVKLQYALFPDWSVAWYLITCRPTLKPEPCTDSVNRVTGCPELSSKVGVGQYTGKTGPAVNFTTSMSSGHVILGGSSSKKLTS